MLRRPDISPIPNRTALRNYFRVFFCKNTPKLIALISLLVLVAYSSSSIDSPAIQNSKVAIMTESKVSATDTGITTEGFAFEVHGKVQGVFFRKYTKQKAHSLHLLGWVKNTPNGTVKGEVVLPAHKKDDTEALKEMRRWLQYVGSPKSRISGVNLTVLMTQDVDNIRKETNSMFEIRRS
uniref:acylphosphatase n=1 Tax=Ditylum brightwellii TaxID=49249 RepID=A0A6U3NJQ1_9STRA|mmetsp:Transcript_10052/g.14937  ORF Transcript_10052/g.14937 Transcript_10052/m.14937 type:complete len:180 (-) Transcript_10052:104-643(-)